MVKIKFCGLRTREDIEAANLIKPDFIGFVFYKKSKRYIDETTARNLKKSLSASIKAVGVFVDEEPETIKKLFEVGIIDMAQLHGMEDDAYIERLKSLVDIPIIKAFGVKGHEDLHKANISKADYVLLDGKNAGSGNTFDWSLLKNAERPFLLAGGLNKDNVRDALKMAKPYGLDLSSGIETDGRKDPRKMEEFARIIRSFNE